MLTGLTHMAFNDQNRELASKVIRDQFRGTSWNQAAREMVRNSLEAGATNIEVVGVALEDHIDGQSLEVSGRSGVKRAFVDDGPGMSANKLRAHMGDLGSGDKDMSNNWNFGSRGATLPNNPFGMIVASWTKDEEEGYLIWLALDPQTNVYGAVPWQVDEYDENGEVTTVIDSVRPVGDADALAVLKHPMIEHAGQGTVVVLLGGAWEDDTLRVPPRDPVVENDVERWDYPKGGNQRQDWHYLNAKFAQKPRYDVNVAVVCYTGETSSDDAPEGGGYVPPAKGQSRRNLRFLFDEIDNLVKKEQAQRGVVRVEHDAMAARVHWALLNDDERTRSIGKSATSDYPFKWELFGELHDGELYNLHYRGPEGEAPGGATNLLANYGLVYGEVRKRIVLVVEPEPESPTNRGAVPRMNRQKLAIGNNDLPHREWGLLFQDHLPEPLKEALRQEAAKSQQSDMKGYARDLQKQLKKFLRRPRRRLTDEPGRDGQDLVPDRPDRNPDPDPPKDRPQPPDAQPGEDKGKRRRIAPVHGQGTRRSVVTGRKKPQTDITAQMVAADSEDWKWGPSAAAYYVENSRHIFINQDSPFVAGYVDEAVAARNPSREEQVREIAREEIRRILVAYVATVENGAEVLDFGSTMDQEQPLGRTYAEMREEALSVRGLTAAMMNYHTITRSIDEAFGTKQGLGKNWKQAA